MISALCIYLSGPLASFAAAPGNVERATADRPTRSALLGLAGAALGILRTDDKAQADLSESFSTASLTLSPGALLTDFHTTQTIPRSKQFYSTRAKALRGGTVNTLISRREYRSDGAWQVAFIPTADGQGGTQLKALAQAFKQPTFSLWLGRKSCPLGHPLVPKIVSGNDLSELFANARSEDVGLADLPVVKRFTQGPIACDDALLLARSAPVGGDPRTLPVRRNRRQDQPVDRRRWSFSARDEFEFMSTALATSVATAPTGEGRS